MLEGMQQRFGWEPVLSRATSSASPHEGAIQPGAGGAARAVGRTLETIHQTCDEVNEHLREVQEVADRSVRALSGWAPAPIWTHEQMPLMPKGRYN